MKRSIELYIKDIFQYMERAKRHVAGMEMEIFLRNDTVCDAVIRCIEVIGEATKHVPEEIRREYPSIPWNDMAGMRDKIIHGYFSVDYENVWLVVKEEIPKLQPKIMRIMEDCGIDSQ